MIHLKNYIRREVELEQCYLRLNSGKNTLSHFKKTNSLVRRFFFLISAFKLKVFSVPLVRCSHSYKWKSVTDVYEVL